MYRKFLFFLVLIILFIIQVSFINPLSPGLVPLNLFLILLTILVFQLELISLLWWALIIGLIADLYPVLPFGTGMIIVIITSLSLYLLFKNFLTNRSLYTFILLTLVGTLIYNLLYYLSSLFFYSTEIISYSLVNNRYWAGLFWQVILNILIAFFLFLFSHFISKRFQNKFLVTK